MEIKTDYPSIVQAINSQTRDLLKKYEIEKEIVFKIKPDTGSIESFMKQFECFIESIVNEIIVQLPLYQTAVKDEEQKRTLIDVYNIFKEKNKEIYSNLLFTTKGKDEILNQSESTDSLNNYQSILNQSIKDEKSLSKRLDQLKYQQKQLLKKKKMEYNQIEQRKEIEQSQLKRHLIIFILLMVAVIYYHLSNLK